MNNKFFHYPECGLDYIYLLNGLKEPEGNPFKTNYTLHEKNLYSTIIHYLVHKRTNLLGKEIKFIRNYLSMTQEELGQHLNVSLNTILNWEKNKSRIHGSSEYLLKLLSIDNGITEIEQKLYEFSGLGPFSIPKKIIFERIDYIWEYNKNLSEYITKEE